LLFPTQPSEVQIEKAQALSLEDAIALAERNNGPLQVSKLQLERSQFVLKEQKAANLPTLSTSANLTNQEVNNNTLADTPTGQGDITGSGGQGDNFNFEQVTGTTQVGANLRFDYNIYTGGLRKANIRAAEKQVRLNELVVEQQLEQLRLDVATDYYNLQNADEQVRIAQQAVTNAEQSLKDAQALEQAGLGTRFDTLRAEVQLADAQQSLTNTIAQQRTARRQLVERINLSQEAEVNAADPVEVAGEWQLSLEESIVLAYKNRSELEQQLVQREITEQQRRAALAAIRPRVSLFGQYDLSKDFVNTGSNSGTFSDARRETFTRQYQVGVQVQWNFFDGGAAKARAKQQELDKAIAEVNFSDSRSQIRFQVEQSFFTLTSNRENIQTATKAREQARESLRLARLRFQAGVGTQTDVINAETELTRAEGNLISAIIGYNQALANLKRAVSNYQFPNQVASTASPPAR
jgi:OMF family outer membrane factor